MALVDLTLLDARLNCLSAKLKNSLQESCVGQGNILDRVHVVVNKVAEFEQKMPQFSDLESGQNMLKEAEKTLLTSPVKLLQMATVLRLKEAQLQTFVSLLEEVKEHRGVLSAGKVVDNNVLKKSQFTQLETAGLKLAEDITAQTRTVNILLDQYEESVKRMSLAFVRWDALLAQKEKECGLYADGDC